MLRWLYRAPDVEGLLFCLLATPVIPPTALCSKAVRLTGKVKGKKRAETMKKCIRTVQSHTIFFAPTMRFRWSFCLSESRSRLR